MPSETILLPTSAYECRKNEESRPAPFLSPKMSGTVYDSAYGTLGTHCGKQIRFLRLSRTPRKLTSIRSPSSLVPAGVARVLLPVIRRERGWAWLFRAPPCRCRMGYEKGTENGESASSGCRHS